MSVGSRRRPNGEPDPQVMRNGKYRVLIELPPDGSGNRKRHSITADTYKECREKQKAFERELAKGLHRDRDRENQTVAEYFEWYLQEVDKRKNSVKTHENKRSSLRANVIPRIGDIKLKKLTHEHVQMLVNTLSDEKRKPSSIALIHGTIRTALNHAVYPLRLIGENPALHVVLPKRSKRRLQVWNEEQVATFIQSLNGHDMKCLFVLMIMTGIRRGEALGLCWEDINWERREITIQRSLQRSTDTGPILVDTKTGRHRVIKVPEMMISLLRQQYQDQIAISTLAGFQRPNTLVFTRKDGTEMSIEHPRHELMKIIKDTGLPKIRLHDLRHTCATILLHRKIGVRVVMDLLGHSKIGTTMDTYAHVLEEGKQEAANEMERAFGI